MAEHEIEVLNGRARGAFDQVVDAAYGNDLPADNTRGDVAEIGCGRVFRGRQAFDDTDKRLVRVEAAECFEQLLLRDAIARPAVRGAEDSSVHRNQMRGEEDPGLFAGCPTQVLGDFRRMPVPAQVVAHMLSLHSG